MTKYITLIGTDSSHCLAFAKLLKEQNAEWQILYAIKDYRSSLPLSIERRLPMEAEMRNFGITIFDKLSQPIVERTDAFIIASVDASLHLSQFEEIAKFHKPVFIDKPIAYSIQTAEKIEAISSKFGTPYFSSSSLRFSASVVKATKVVKNSTDKQWQVHLFGPINFKEGIPGMYWYGIHLIESLLTIFPNKFIVDDVRIDELKDNIKIFLHAENCQCEILGDMVNFSAFRGEITSTNSHIDFDTSKDSKKLYSYLLDTMIPFFDSKINPLPFTTTKPVLQLVEAINSFLIN